MIQPQMQAQTQESDGAHQRARTYMPWERGARGLLVGWLLASAACGVSDEGTLPPDVQDPSTIRTPSGAMGLYRQTMEDFSFAFDGAITAGGLMTDELASLPIALGTLAPTTSLDHRQAPSFSPKRFHQLRAQAREAREFLLAYATDSSVALPGHMYAAEGYAEIFLADLYCSGIPLSTMNFEGDYTLTPGFSTEEVYGHALALLDTALGLTSDSARFQHLVALGRGRALLALDRYAEAAAAVAAVPDEYQYDLTVAWSSSGTAFASSSTTPPDSLMLVWYWTRSTSASSNNRRVGAPTVGNQEGGNGLDYRTSNDPRTQFVAKGVSAPPDTLYMPRKYTRNGTTVSSPIALRLASGIEARLIEAEAALQANPDDGLWLQRLNHLRQTMWTSIFPATAGPLPDLADPGTDAARVDLVFHERAFWLYLTGQRQGDLRRLIRQYNRQPHTVYPTGFYPGGTGQYGDEVVVPMPDEERQLNPHYTGCLHRNA